MSFKDELARSLTDTETRLAQRRFQSEIEMAIDALQSIRLFRNHFASSRPAILHIQSVVKMLHGLNQDAGPYGGLLHNLADAISKTYLSQPASAVTGEPSSEPASEEPRKTEPRER